MEAYLLGLRNAEVFAECLQAFSLLAIAVTYVWQARRRRK